MQASNGAQKELAAVYKHERLSLAGANRKTSNAVGVWPQLSI